MKKDTIILGGLTLATLLLGLTSASGQTNGNGTGNNTPSTSGGGASDWVGYGVPQGSKGSITESYLGVPLAGQRGISNNNPLNIKTYAMNANYDYWKKELKWSDNTDGVFCQFELFAYGLRAALYLMKKYKTTHGIDTIDGLIGRWDRPTATHYMDYVSNGSGFSRTQIIDLTDKETLKRLIKPMCELECSQYQLSDAQVDLAYSLL